MCVKLQLTCAGGAATTNHSATHRLVCWGLLYSQLHKHCDEEKENYWTIRLYSNMNNEGVYIVVVAPPQCSL